MQEKKGYGIGQAIGGNGLRKAVVFLCGNYQLSLYGSLLFLDSSLYQGSDQIRENGRCWYGQKSHGNLFLIYLGSGMLFPAKNSEDQLWTSDPAGGGGAYLLFSLGARSSVYCSDGEYAFHVWDLWSERKKAAVVACVACISIMVFGIVAQMICGTNWFTNTLGSVLLGVMLLSLYSFFFYI